MTGLLAPRRFASVHGRLARALGPAHRAVVRPFILRPLAVAIRAVDASVVGIGGLAEGLFMGVWTLGLWLLGAGRRPL